MLSSCALKNPQTFYLKLAGQPCAGFLLLISLFSCAFVQVSLPLLKTKVIPLSKSALTDLSGKFMISGIMKIKGGKILFQLIIIPSPPLTLLLEAVKYGLVS